MSGDKLKRVKAVKKWLEKAEDSYSSHEEITGELNLIMAKAEMQRLDETHPHAKLKRWGLRGCAMIVAVLVFGGASWLGTSREEPKTDPLVPVEVVVNEQAPKEPVAPPAEAPAPAPVETAGPVQTVSASQVDVREAPQPQPAPEPVYTAPAPAPAPAAPALSAQEIQSVVGEAGRALRGEN